MYEDKYYNVYFTMTTEDDKKISEMSYSELYWVKESLSHYVDSIDEAIKERYQDLCDETRKEQINKLADKYLDIIEAGVGRKCKKHHLEAYDILLDIFFHKTE